MSAHNTIVLTAAPAGRFLEGTISGTPKPGTMMQVKAATALDGSGRPTWEVFNRAADGDRGLVAILRENVMVGKGLDDAYADGDRGYLYCPIPGDELQVRLTDVSGTGDDIAVGDHLIVDDGVGTFIKSASTPQSEPFVALEAFTDPTTSNLCHCFYTGH